MWGAGFCRATRVHGSPVRVLCRGDTTMECNYSIHNRAAVPQECCLMRCMPLQVHQVGKHHTSISNMYLYTYSEASSPHRSSLSFANFGCPPTQGLIPVQHRIGRALRVTLTSSGSGTAAKHLCQAGVYVSEEPSARLPASLIMPRRSGMQSTYRWWRMWWCTAPGRGRPGFALGPCRGTRLPGR
jgi:hypothetical protein